MQFDIRTASWSHNERQRDEYKDLFKYELTTKINPWDNKSYSYFECTPKGPLEINSLEELMAFVEKYGQIVLDKYDIIIYDDYLE